MAAIKWKYLAYCFLNNLRTLLYDAVRAAIQVLLFIIRLLIFCISNMENLGQAVMQAEHMFRLGMDFSEESILLLLQRSIKVKDVVIGRHIHRLLVGLGLDKIAIFAEHLIRLFTFSHCLFEVNLVFSKVEKPNAFTWHALILANINQHNNAKALELYGEMQQTGFETNKFIYMGALKACSNIAALGHGRLINGHIIRSSLESDVVVGNTLIDMYAKAGSLTDAYKLFNDLPCRDMLSWGALLGGYVKQGESGHALELFQVMLLEGIKLNKVIALCMLKACGVSEALLQGRLLHLEVIELNVLTDPVIISALIDMYAKCGSLSDACNVLESSTTRCMVSWGALFGGLIDQGEYSTAFKMFERMSQDGIKPNEFIFSCLASACGKLKNLQRANFLHDQIIKNGVETDTVLGNTLVGMYTDCGSLLMARKVFNTLDSRSLVSWSTMISGYTQNGSALDAVKLFELMQHEGIKPNMVIYSSVLKACSILGAIGLGKLVHHFMIKNDEELDVVVGTTLIELYASCHSLCEACNVFYQIPNRNTVCWGVMVTSMAQHGMFELAKQYLDRMHQQGFKADAKVFTNILAACNQKGRSEEGQQFFELMMDVHDIVPSPEHIHCIVDLLGRKGLLMRAMKLLQSIHNTKDLCGWISLLSACRLHGNVALGRQCFKHIISLDYHVGAAYMLMSCIYAEAHMWDDYYELMEVMKKDMVREELVQ